MSKQRELTDEIYFKLKGATPEQRRIIGEILMANYKTLVNEIVNDADYASVDGYWTDFQPVAHPILSTNSFIKKYKYLLVSPAQAGSGKSTQPLKNLMRKTKQQQ